MDDNLTPWQRYKKNLGETRPWHIISQHGHYVSEDEQTKRMSICESCPELISLTKQCKKCGCIMSLKTKLEKASCPLNKW